MGTDVGTHTAADAPGRTSRRRGPGRAGVFALAGLTAGLVVAGLGVAGAQTSTSEPPTVTSETPGADERKPGGPRHFKEQFRGRGGPHFGFRSGPSAGIHGEFTAPSGDGTFRTVATQTGEVTSVSDSKLAVRSADGYDRTYTVDEDTFVNAGRDGIGDVKVGDEVHVVALVEDGTAKARKVADTTNLRRGAEAWGHKRPR